MRVLDGVSSLLWQSCWCCIWPAGSTKCTDRARSRTRRLWRVRRSAKRSHMRRSQAIRGTTYEFPSLRELLAKASPSRSGDQLAGVAAASMEESVAARMVLADVPLSHFLQEVIVPYESDE